MVFLKILNKAAYHQLWAHIFNSLQISNSLVEDNFILIWVFLLRIRVNILLRIYVIYFSFFNFLISIKSYSLVFKKIISLNIMVSDIIVFQMLTILGSF